MDGHSRSQKRKNTTTSCETKQFFYSVGESQFRRVEKKLSTLPTLCKRPTLVFFLDPTKPLQSIRTGDTVLVKIAVERRQARPKHFRGGWGEKGKDDKKQIHSPVEVQYV